MKKVTTKIIHIPYLEFTGDETNLINIAPITVTNDTIFEIKVKTTNLSYYQGIIGGGNNVDDRILLSTSNKDKNLINASFFNNRFTLSLDELFDGVLRLEKYHIYVNHKKYTLDIHNPIRDNSTYDRVFYIGGRANEITDRSTFTGGYLYYLRIERKNSLYKHYLPCVRFYNIVDDDNTIVYENLMDYGFFESVNQEYYIADSNSIPAHTGDTLNNDYSNMLDINSNIINYLGGG